MSYQQWPLGATLGTRLHVVRITAPAYRGWGEVNGVLAEYVNFVSM